MFQSKYNPYCFIAAIVILHRVALIVYLNVDYGSLISASGSLLTWQYLPISILKNDLFNGLFYLQQSPPLPQIILGLFLKLFDFPVEVGYALIFFQAAISLVSAVLLYYLLTISSIRSIFAAAFTIVFLLSADLIFLEYNSFGQTFYENLCMPLLLGSIWALLLYRQTAARRYLVYLGLLVSALALTRAGFGYFFIPLAIFLYLTRVKVKNVLIFLLPIILFQGGWAFKNLYVYGYFSLPATSWTGLNLQSGVVNRGKSEELRGSILSHPEHYPQWFYELTRDHELFPWDSVSYGLYVPKEIKEIDKTTASYLPENPSGNTMAVALVAKYSKQAVFEYVIANPRLFFQGAFLSYLRFWTPIREYPRGYVSLLFAKRSLPDIWNEGGGSAFLRGDYEINNYYILQRIRSGFLPVNLGDQSSYRPSGLVALPYAGFLVYLFNIISIHILGPLLLVVLQGYKKSIRIDQSYLLFLYLIYLYAAVVMTIGDHGENNRFRLAVEPVIWLLTAIIFNSWIQVLNQAKRRNQSSDEIRSI